jgi:hypothetical protein
MCVAAALGVALFLQGCDSDNTGTSSSQPAKPELATGRFALQKMIAPGHLWAGDAQPIRMASTSTKDHPGHDGKAGYWQTTFASPSRQKAVSFSWSGLVGPDAPARGVDHGREDSFSPNNLSTQPFDLAFLKIDSDRAFEVAQQHGGKQLLDKDPNQPVIYILDWDATSNQLRWHVIYGSSANTSRLTVIVNAATGEFTHKE